MEDWEQCVSPKDMAHHALDYIQHIQWVMHGIALIQAQLTQRLLTHDRSKIVPGMERDIYARVVPEFQGKVFGSEEHKAVGRKLGPAWDHHLAHNRHHPEYHESGIAGMNLVDLIEMLADWKAASLRSGQGGAADVQDSITKLREKHDIVPQLEMILRNTVHLLDDVEKNGRVWSQNNLE